MECEDVQENIARERLVLATHLDFREENEDASKSHNQHRRDPAEYVLTDVILFKSIFPTITA